MSEQEQCASIEHVSANAPVVGDVEALDVAARERGREERGADIVEVVLGDVELCEGRVQVQGQAQGLRGAGLELVEAEVEVGELHAELEHLGETRDASVAKAVGREVEVPQAAAGSEGRDERAHALEVDGVAGELEVREGRGMAEPLRDDCGADGPEAVAAGDCEALQVRAELEHAAQAVDCGLAAEQGERGDCGAPSDSAEPLQARGVCRRLLVPVYGAHAHRGGQQHGVNDGLHAFADAAQHGCVLAAAFAEDVAPHVVRDVVESLLEGLRVQHRSLCNYDLPRERLKGWHLKKTNLKKNEPKKSARFALTYMDPNSDVSYVKKKCTVCKTKNKKCVLFKGGATKVCPVNTSAGC